MQTQAAKAQWVFVLLSLVGMLLYTYCQNFQEAMAKPQVTGEKDVSFLLQTCLLHQNQGYLLWFGLEPCETLTELEETFPSQLLPLDSFVGREHSEVFMAGALTISSFVNLC